MFFFIVLGPSQKLQGEAVTAVTEVDEFKYLGSTIQGHGDREGGKEHDTDWMESARNWNTMR